MKLTFRYRAYPDKTTTAKAAWVIDRCRELYNLALEQRITTYHISKSRGDLTAKGKPKSLNYYDQQNELPLFKEANPEYKEIPSQILQDVVRRIDGAYKSFFRRVKAGEKEKGFPRFKGRDFYNSITLNNPNACWKLKDNRLYVTRIGVFKLKLHRPIMGTIKQICIKREGEKWFVLFSCDNVPAPEYPEPRNGAIGIDLGVINYAALSDGAVIENPKNMKAVLKELRRKQRALSRCRRGSNRRKKVKKSLAKTHNKIANQRADFQHNLSRKIVEDNAVICAEKLNVKNMTAGGGAHKKAINRDMCDAAWADFIFKLGYKANATGREFVLVNPKGTSQICSGCGIKVPKDLSVRIHDCPNCHLKIDRDVNAAKNILRAGLALRALTVGDSQAVVREPCAHGTSKPLAWLTQALSMYETHTRAKATGPGQFRPARLSRNPYARGSHGYPEGAARRRDDETHTRAEAT